VWGREWGIWGRLGSPVEKGGFIRVLGILVFDLGRKRGRRDRGRVGPAGGRSFIGKGTRGERDIGVSVSGEDGRFGGRRAEAADVGRGIGVGRGAIACEV